MRVKLLFLFFLFGLVLFVRDDFIFSLEPANPGATEATKKVLNYLNDLPNHSSKRVIVGQHYGNNQKLFNSNILKLYETTGFWPGIIGSDYKYGITSTGDTDYSRAPTLEEVSLINKPLIDYWNKGGLITIYYASRNPWTGGSCSDISQRNLIELITPGTTVNTNWKKELDKIAAGLTELREAGVVVLFRPFPEMTFKDDNWYGIGAHSGDPEPFKNMWKYLFNYFVNVKKLNNLLWIYAAANTDKSISVTSTYPGGDYVDIIGVDLYSDSFDSLAIKGSGYEKLTSLGKPFVLAEAGAITQLDGAFDNVKIINGIKNNYPKAVYFLVWKTGWSGGSKWAIVDNRNAKALLSDLWVITREEINWGQGPSLPTSTASYSFCLICTSGLSKSLGNANCDSEINILDFYLLRDVLIKLQNGESVTEAEKAEVDFNCQQGQTAHTIDLQDFNVRAGNYKKGFYF